MKIKSLTVAVLLTGAAGTANAALDIGQTLGTPSSFVLSIVDNNTGNTYLQNLGLSYADLVNGVITSKTWTLDAAFSTFSNSPNALSYNVTGGYAVDDVNLSNFDKTGVIAPFSDPTGAQWGLVTTAKAGGAGLQTGYNELANSAGTVSGQGFLQGWVGTVDGALNGANSTTKAATAGLSYYDANFAQGGPANSVGASTVQTSDNAHLFWLSNSIGFGSDPGILKDLGTISLNGNVLTFAANSTGPAPVPVPAAVWLLGSALLGMVSIGRRENKTA